MKGSIRSSKNILILIYFYWFGYVLCISNYLKQFSWPRFYSTGESTPPTQSILRNLTYYQSKWEQAKIDYNFGETYSMTYAWDCTLCDTCFKANKYIIVEDDIITSLTTSTLNDITKIEACESSNTTNQIQQYKTLDELYTILIKWVEAGIDKSDYLIMELMIDPFYYYPSDVKLSANKSYIAWDIVCFEPNVNNDETEVCDYDPSDDENEQVKF